MTYSNVSIVLLYHGLPVHGFGMQRRFEERNGFAFKFLSLLVKTRNEVRGENGIG